jgi:pilus assembly protein CpaB
LKKIKILAFISALTTAVLLYIFLGSLSDLSKGKRVNVLTAANDISANTPITAEMLKYVSMPAESVVPRALSDSSLVVGKVSQEKIFMGEQILSTKLVATGEGSAKTLAYAIEPGKRAITISVNNTSGVGFMLAPGNNVDLLGYFATTGPTSNAASPNNTASVAVVLMENLKVLAVDNVIAKEGKTKSDQASYSSLTLQVTPEQALKLTMAQAEGEIKAVLRSPLDSASVKQQKITLGSVLN